MQRHAAIDLRQPVAGDRPVGAGDVQAPAVGQGAEPVAGGKRHHLAAGRLVGPAGGATGGGAGQRRAAQAQQLAAARLGEGCERRGWGEKAAHAARGYQAAVAAR
jgi:hypothetical protein